MVQKLLRTSIIVLLACIYASNMYAQDGGDTYLTVFIKSTSTATPVELDPDIWRGLEGVKEIATDNELTYVYGSASDMKSAKKLMKDVSKAGFKDAQVVGISNGSQITAEKAEEIIAGGGSGIESAAKAEEVKEVVADTDAFEEKEEEQLEDIAKEIKEEEIKEEEEEEEEAAKEPEQKDDRTIEEKESAQLSTSMTYVDKAAMEDAEDENKRSSGEKNSGLFDFHEQNMLAAEQEKMDKEKIAAEERKARQDKIAELTANAAQSDQGDIVDQAGFETVGGKENPRQIHPVVGAGVGFLIYYGDLTKLAKSSINGLSRAAIGYNVGVSQRLGDMFGVGVDVTLGNVSGSFRELSTLAILGDDGSDSIPAYTGIKHNFQSNIMAFDAQLIIHGDNNLSSKREQTRATAYAIVGVGYVIAKVNLDLKDKYGAEYHYWRDGQIRSIAQDSSGYMDSDTLKRDYIYETSAGKTGSVTFPLGIGAKFKVTNSLDCNIFGKYHFMLGDDIDDFVDGGPDKFLYAGISINYKIGRGTGSKPEYKGDIDDIFYTMDSDGDGVQDSKDECPDTYLGEAVDKKGCAVNSVIEDEYSHSTNVASDNDDFDADANDKEHAEHEAELKAIADAKAAKETGKTNLLGSEGSGNSETASSDGGSDEIEFKIQIRTDTKEIELTPGNFKGLKNVELYKQWETFKYVVGHCKSIEEALKLQSEVRKLYPNAFAIAFKNGQRTTFTEAKRILGVE
ncbi:MAG: hypothetical protein HRT71_11720 [Flavobacteriales bacterium]|nr:hypothetical protein [Flavobacteriales bacterium]